MTSAPDDATDPHRLIAGMVEEALSAAAAGVGDAAGGDSSSDDGLEGADAPDGPDVDGAGRAGGASDGVGDDGGDSGPRALGYDVAELNREWALVLMGSKAVVMREQPDAPIEDRTRVLNLDAFKAWYANRYTERRDPKDGKIKAVTWASAWLSSRQRRQYAGIEFQPLAPGETGDVAAGYYNLWRGHACQPAATGSWSILRDHLLTNICGGDQTLFDWVFGWFAHIFQRPRERIGTALVLRGKMGTGKTKLGEAIGSLIPHHYFMVDDPRYVTGQFNAHMASCLLLQAEEAVWAGDKAAEGRLKGLITSRFQMIEQKGVDPIRLDNHVRLVMTSNEGWVVPAGKDERRFCVLDVAPHVAQNHSYFAELDRELDNGGRARLLHDLLSVDLTKLNLRQIPMTGALLEQKIRSLDSVEAWWLQRLMEGRPTTKADAWPGTVAKEDLHADYIAYADSIGVKRRAVETEMGMALAKLCPDMPETRIYDPAVNRRRRHYRLPHLAGARALFDDAMGQALIWPEIEDGDLAPNAYAQMADAE